jgi:hypothetical protein
LRLTGSKFTVYLLWLGTSKYISFEDQGKIKTNILWGYKDAGIEIKPLFLIFSGFCLYTFQLEEAIAGFVLRNVLNQGLPAVFPQLFFLVLNQHIFFFKCNIGFFLLKVTPENKEHKKQQQ